MNLGCRIYGLGALLLGVVGLVWDDFALVWQPVPHGVPGRSVLAYIVAAILAIAGTSLLWPRTAKWGAAALAVLYALGVLFLHVPHIVARPLVLDSWAGTAEQTALVAGGALAFASLAPLNAETTRAVLRASWIAFGICCLVFGLVHFVDEHQTASFVPAYLPLGQDFWARFTGAAHIAAGLGILSGIRARLAAQMLTAMFVCFSAFVHVPLLMSDLHSHFYWVMNGMNLALIGSAWVVADSLRGRSVWGK